MVSRLLLLLNSLLAVAAVPHPAEARAAGGTGCHCFPGDDCWPSNADWDKFNATVSGRLIKTVPLAAPCHKSSFGSYDAGKCEQIRSTWSFPEPHIESSSSPLSHFWANNSCDPFSGPNDQCITGALVQYSVKAASADDYKKTIAFAQSKNIRLIIRNTGHDYIGRSTGAGALALWTHFLKDQSVVDYKSTAYNGKAIKVGAGVQGFEVEKFAQDKGLVVVSGNCPTVGLVGGYAQGGGHGALATKFGLAADQVLEWEVITSCGQQLVATPEKYADLYWALTGGGGGAYGAVVSATVRAYPDTYTSAANLTFTNQGVDDDVFYDSIKTYLGSLPDLVDTGASTIFLAVPGTFLVQPATALGQTKEQLQKHMDPILNKLKQEGVKYDYHIDQFPTYLESRNQYNPSANITEFNLGGRLLPRELAESDEGLDKMVQAIRDINDNGAVVSGIVVNVAKGQKVPNSVNPAWRKAIVSAVLGLPYNQLDFESNIALQKKVTDELVPKLTAISPDSGAYLNEADPNQPNFQQTFYGDNYQKLKAIKTKYDPMTIFYGRTGVGSEAWTQKPDGRLCRS